MKYESKYALFNYDEKSAYLIGELSNYLDENAEGIFDFFNVASREKVIINIVSTKEEFDLKFINDHSWANVNTQIPKWTVGYYINNQITYLSLDDYKNTTHAFANKNYNIALEYYKKTIAHEFVHYVNDLFTKENGCSYTEKYLKEGIATYLSGQKKEEDLKFDFSLHEILEKNMNNTCYKGWYILVKYLIENYDKSFVLDLFKSNRRARVFLEEELYNKAKERYGKKYERRD